MVPNNDKAEIIRAVCQALSQNDPTAVRAVAKEYPFVTRPRSSRNYAPFDATRIFLRDGFIDRYSAARLINPGVLRLLSDLYPALFPFHKNWKMSETHPAYWEQMPTIDHRVPVARGGSDSEDNWITTSMLRNSAKANWTLEELGWQVFPAGKLSDWDGLTRWFIDYIENQEDEDHSQYVMRWYRAAKRSYADAN